MWVIVTRVTAGGSSYMRSGCDGWTQQASRAQIFKTEAAAREHFEKHFTGDVEYVDLTK